RRRPKSHLSRRPKSQFGKRPSRPSPGRIDEVRGLVEAWPEVGGGNETSLGQYDRVCVDSVVLPARRSSASPRRLLVAWFVALRHKLFVASSLVFRAAAHHSMTHIRAIRPSVIVAWLAGEVTHPKI